MPDKEYIDIANLQLEKAKQLLSFIPEHISIGDYATAINRSYYAAFHSLKALEALTVMIQRSIAERYPISEKILLKPPKQGYLTISNALQWRLKYGNIFNSECELDGVYKYDKI